MILKQSAIFFLCLLIGACTLIFHGCIKVKPADPDPPGSVEPAPAEDDGSVITFVNEREETDIWILPDTDENRKLSLWGAPTIDDLGEGKQAELSLSALGGPGLYVIHMINPDGMYYGVSEVRIEAGYTLVFRTGDWVGAYELEVRDADGETVKVYEVFGAML
jgi:hypothetical protein